MKTSITKKTASKTAKNNNLFKGEKNGMDD